jgi:hypothetical protein
VSIYVIVAIATIMALVIATASFIWPNRVYIRSAVAAICAWGLPYVAAFAVGPFLGEGAGMGVAFILYALSAVIFLAAISASLGAAARHIWMAIRG